MAGMVAQGYYLRKTGVKKPDLGENGSVDMRNAEMATGLAAMLAAGIPYQKDHSSRRTPFELTPQHALSGCGEQSTSCCSIGGPRSNVSRRRWYTTTALIRPNLIG